MLLLAHFLIRISFIQVECVEGICDGKDIQELTVNTRSAAQMLAVKLKESRIKQNDVADDSKNTAHTIQNSFSYNTEDRQPSSLINVVDWKNMLQEHRMKS